MIKELSLSISQLLGISTTIAILVAICICALWTIWLNRIKEGQRAEFEKHIEKYKLDLAKELEALKTKNQNTNYITKTQFNAEFKMYQELSASIFELSLKIGQLYPKSVMNNILNANLENATEDEIIKLKYNNAINNLQVYQNQLRKYAPFINKNLYKKLDDFRTSANSQLVIYKLDKVDKKTTIDCQNKINEDFTKRTCEIENDYENIIEDLRNYLQSLKVMDGNNE